MNTGHNPPTEWSTLVELLRWRALYQPDQRGYTFLDGDAQEVHLTYAELDHQARLIAAMLQSRGAVGERVLLVYPPSLEYVAAFFGCLYAGAVAVPVYPPDPIRLERTLPRFRAIVNDAQPSMSLTMSPILSLAETLFALAPDVQAMHWLATDAIADTWAGEWRDPAVSRDSMAFLQYTSGSTAAPKGVMVGHGNILHNERMIQLAFEHTEQSTIVGWLPLYHDMGLIGNMLQPLYLGSQCVLMSPLDFLKRPLRWLQAISRYKAHTSGAPNFAYDLCARKIKPEQLSTLDLSSWQVAFNGSEPVRHGTLERFAQTFAPCGFRREALYPCYGLAEATLFVAGNPKSSSVVYHAAKGPALECNQVIATTTEDRDCRTLVGCGRTWLNQQIVIVNPETSTPCPPDRVGEIWISGPHVAQGYWNRPEETRQTFQAHLSTGEGPFLRTGDLGFLKDGELFIAGRLKDMIIIDGRNLYPQDIELTIEQSHTAIRPGGCAAFGVDVSSKERLVVVAEVDHRQQTQPDSAPTQRPALNGSEVVKAGLRAISEQYDVQAHDIVLLKAGSIPKTSSGKIQRHACRAGYLAGSLEVWSGE